MLGMADIAALLADRTRSQMLEELLGGDPLPAGVLAGRAGVAPSTASEHLARLEAGGLVTIERRGRRRLARLAGPEVAAALEALGRLSAPERPRGLTNVNRMEALRAARSCYDHLAGGLGAALLDSLLARRWVERRRDDRALRVTPTGRERLAGLGLACSASARLGRVARMAIQ